MPKRIIGPKKPTRETALPGSMQTYDIDNKGFLERRGIQLTTISPALIKNARNQAASGNLGPLHELYEKMETSETFFWGACLCAQKRRKRHDHAGESCARTIQGRAAFGG